MRKPPVKFSNRLLALSIRPTLWRHSLGWGLALSAALGHAAPGLRCEVTYAGATQELQVRPTNEPYLVQPFNIADRFSFKVVMSAPKGKLAHVLIYAYLQQEPRPLLLQEAQYFPPFPSPASRMSLTGVQHLYGGPIERELIYQCWLREVKP